MLRKMLRLTAVMAMVLCTVTAAQADLVSLTTLNGQSSEPTLDQSGTLVAAVNFTPNVSPTVNQGITFSNVTSVGSGQTITLGTWNGITLSATQQDLGFAMNWGMADLGVTHSDPWWTFLWPNNNGAKITASGLDSSKTYQVQYMAADTRSGSLGYGTEAFLFHVTASDDSSNTLTGNWSWGANTYGLATAKASNTTSISLDCPYTWGHEGLGLAGVVIHEVVPEPSVLCLIATGLVGLLAYAWRKRR
jgi:hypothetical protein